MGFWPILSPAESRSLSTMSSSSVVSPLPLRDYLYSFETSILLSFLTRIRSLSWSGVLKDCGRDALDYRLLLFVLCDCSLIFTEDFY